MRLHSASITPMTTLYVRDVPTDVAQTLKDRAAAEGKSLSAYVVAELSRIASRPTSASTMAEASMTITSGTAARHRRCRR